MILLVKKGAYGMSKLKGWIPDWVQRTHYRRVLCEFCGGDGLKHDRLIHEKVEDDVCPNCMGDGYVEEMI